jgi:uncharacterized membrane protein
MTVSIVDGLNQWNTIGVFSYVLPFLIIFAATYGILSKIKVFEDNNAVNAIISVAIGLLALQLDFVPVFFMEIFPRFGMGLGVLLVIVILFGFFLNDQADKNKWKEYSWIGLVLAVAIILWSLSAWQWGGDQYGLGSWFETNFWAIVIGILIGIAIYFIVKKRTP